MRRGKQKSGRKRDKKSGKGSSSGSGSVRTWVVAEIAKIKGLRPDSIADHFMLQGDLAKTMSVRATRMYSVSAHIDGSTSVGSFVRDIERRLNQRRSRSHN